MRKAVRRDGQAAQQSRTWQSRARRHRQPVSVRRNGICVLASLAHHGAPAPRPADHPAPPSRQARNKGRTGHLLVRGTAPAREPLAAHRLDPGAREDTRREQPRTPRAWRRSRRPRPAAPRLPRPSARRIKLGPPQRFLQDLPHLEQGNPSLRVRADGRKRVPQPPGVRLRAACPASWRSRARTPWIRDVRFLRRAPGGDRLRAALPPPRDGGQPAALPRRCRAGNARPPRGT